MGQKPRPQDFWLGWSAMHNLTCLLFCGAALGVVTLPCTSRAQAVNEKIFHNVNKTTGSVRDTATDIDQIYFMQPQAFRAGYGSAVGFRGVPVGRPWSSSRLVVEMWRAGAATAAAGAAGTAGA